MQAIRFDIERLRVEPVEVEFSLGAAEFDVASDPEYRFAWPITGRLTGRLVGGTTVYVTGSISTRVGVDCVRCAHGLEFELSVPVHLAFLPQSEQEGEDDDPEDEGLHVYSGDHVDALEALREELLLALPTLANCETLSIGCLDPEARDARRVFGEEAPGPGSAEGSTSSTWQDQMARLRRELGEGPSTN